MADPTPSPYPGYDVLAKWDTPSFNRVTRDVLTRRLHAVPGRRFLTAGEFRLLEAICARLIPQPTGRPPVPIAPFIDADLHDERGPGFRHPDMPPMRQAWRAGLAGIEAEATRRHGRPFADLDAGCQDATLTAIQKGEADAAGFGGMPAAHFFQHVLLKAAAEVYYSHPTAWSEMGFGGPASPRGYVRLGLDERDPWEPPHAPPSGRDGR